MGFKCGIDIQNAGAILQPTSEFAWSNSGVCDSVTDHFGAVSEDSGN